MTNVEKLTAKLNACKNRRRIYNALMALSREPGIQQIEDTREKLQIVVGEIAVRVEEAETA